MTTVSSRDMSLLFNLLRDRLDASREELCRLDGLVGDADHGIAMAQGMQAAAAAVEGCEGTLGDQLNAAAKAFLNAVGASSGPLYATAFMRAAKVAGARTAMPFDEVPLLLVAMAEGIAQRGKAERGQKTMLDAWGPAADAAGLGLAAMADAADAGAEATRDMQATLGRAARLGARSLGHVDPGAVSAAIIIGVVARDWPAALEDGA